jgi:EAL domain-containing protein (putative c-di-GMP-specific phosphodiesterase class I)
VHDIATNPDAAAIVSAIVTLADALKMRAIAEGVEHPLQRECLYEHGCDLMQGYLFGKPTPPEEITKLLRAVAGQAGTTGLEAVDPDAVMKATAPAATDEVIG